MVQGKWFPVGADLSEPLSLRKEVFGRDQDGVDAVAQQTVVYRDGKAVGAARLWWADGAFVLGDVGVLESERGKGFGDLLVRLSLFKALSHNAQRVTLTAPESVRPFFAKYGFVLGEDGRMEIRGEDVKLSHCGGNCAGCDHPSPECAPKALR